MLLPSSLSLPESLSASEKSEIGSSLEDMSSNEVQEGSVVVLQATSPRVEVKEEGEAGERGEVGEVRGLNVPETSLLALRSLCKDVKIGKSEASSKGAVRINFSV